MFFAVWRTLFVMLAVLWATLAQAAGSDSYSNNALTARLISVEDGVAPNAETLSLGLDLQLEEGWKAYWRSPGEVGLPPQIDWTGSRNLASAELLWPAPKRFTAFGIENFGYQGHVVLPVQAVLNEAGMPATLTARVTLLTCSEVCIPHDFNLKLLVPTGKGIDSQAATLLTAFAQKIPLDPTESDIRVTSAAISDEALVVTARSTLAFKTPDIFPEMGSRFTFGKPDIRLTASGREMWARLPLLAQDEVIPTLRITITDGARAMTDEPAWSGTAAIPPFDIANSLPGIIQILSIAGFAFLGGLILNVMPCVLPVLSIKLASVLNQGQRPAHVVRTGFLMSALGVLVFMWVLAAGLLMLQAAGIRVGWGLQFQSPLFLTAMFMLLIVFAANLFGFFEISLPSSLQTRLAKSSGREGYFGDFATGAFAAILATPCSAPFLGTAIAFALTGRPVDLVVVFTALGLGLALPYLIFAARPGWIRHLPRPGRWMVIVKWVLGVLLALTAAWLLWVLNGVAGRTVTIPVFVLAIIFILCATLPMRGGFTRAAVLVAVAVLAAAIPYTLAQPVTTLTSAKNWTTFDRSEIPRLVSQGKTVFVDVTADWCLTCKANKALVLDREPIVGLLQSEDIVAMQADWTRPNAAISRYLEAYDRFGIPFNIVYGPNAPSGVLLSEILSVDAVLKALKDARSSKQ